MPHAVHSARRRSRQYLTDKPVDFKAFLPLSPGLELPSSPPSHGQTPCYKGHSLKQPHATWIKNHMDFLLQSSTPRSRSYFQS